jgi:hypothetical protein
MWCPALQLAMAALLLLPSLCAPINPIDTVTTPKPGSGRYCALAPLHTALFGSRLQHSLDACTDCLLHLHG